MYRDFSSMSAKEESAFVVFEESTVRSAKHAVVIGAMVGIIYFVLTVFIVLSHERPAALIETDDVLGAAGRTPLWPGTALASTETVAGVPSADSAITELGGTNAQGTTLAASTMSTLQ